MENMEYQEKTCNQSRPLIFFFSDAELSSLISILTHRYNGEVPDSYEHLLHDVMDGDNHLFMRSDEVAAAWDILSPVLCDIDENNVAPEPYDLGSGGPVKASQLWAKHGVQWVED